MTVKTIDFDSFIKSNENMLAESLQENGALIINQFPIDDRNKSLIDISLRLGSPTEKDSRYPYIEDGFIHIVKSQENKTKSTDGYQIISTTEHAFEMHTDEYYQKHPADYVILLCVECDPSGGGVTLLAHIDDIITEISSEILNLLEQPVFPARKNKVPILIRNDNKYEVKFNSSEIYNYYTTNHLSIPQNIKDCIDALKFKSSEIAKKIFLHPRDCLVINNNKLLHGRTAFSQYSNRLLKRVRLNKY